MENIFVILLWVVQITVFILSGKFAWDLVNPNSFFDLFGFCIMWGICETIGFYLVIGVFGAIAFLATKNK